MHTVTSFIFLENQSEILHYLNRLEQLSSLLHHLKRLEQLSSLLIDLPPNSEEARLQVELLLTGTTAALLHLLERFFEKWADLSDRFSTFWEMVAEFPRGVRYLCTTMPWTIWPALVVLWGVCWMFAVYPQNPDQSPWAPAQSSSVTTLAEEGRLNGMP